MSRTIYAVFNNKGGAGKSTTAQCMVELSHRDGKRALLVDVDQQCNSTKHFGGRIEGHATIYDLLTDETCNPLESIQHTDHGDLIAGDVLLTNLEADMATATCRETRLVDMLDQIKNNYDTIVIDCPTALGIATTNALVSADEVIIPIDCESYATDGFVKTIELVSRIQGNRRLNPNLRVGGVLLTRYDGRQSLDRSYKAQLPTLAAANQVKAFNTVIRRCVKTVEAQQRAIALYDYAPDSTTMQDYEAFIAELEAGE